jgi:hypothetical protein
MVNVTCVAGTCEEADVLAADVPGMTPGKSLSTGSASSLQGSRSVHGAWHWPSWRFVAMEPDRNEVLAIEPG